MVHDPNRADGVVPEDDVVAEVELDDQKVAVLDGNSTIHLVKATETNRPRERICALNPQEQLDLKTFLQSLTL